jgi:hypothetical protein
VRDTVKTDGLIAIIDPANTPSQRVAEKLGLSLEKRTTGWGSGEREQLIFTLALRSLSTSTGPSTAAGPRSVTGPAPRSTCRAEERAVGSRQVAS